MQFIRGLCRLEGLARAAQLKLVVFCAMASGSQAPRLAHADPPPVLGDFNSPVATQYSLRCIVARVHRENAEVNVQMRSERASGLFLLRSADENTPATSGGRPAASLLPTGTPPPAVLPGPATAAGKPGRPAGLATVPAAALAPVGAPASAVVLGLAPTPGTVLPPAACPSTGAGLPLDTVTVCPPPPPATVPPPATLRSDRLWLKGQEDG